MNNRDSLLDSERLRKLLAGELSEPEHAEVLAWLEQSPENQNVLDQLAATPDLWEKASRLLANLPSQADRASTVQKPNQPQPPLSFLRATNVSGFIGELGHYRIIERIGSGGMGVVLKAMDPALNRIVAIKVLSPLVAEQPVSRRRFLREAQAAAAINHEHVVRIYAVEEEQRLPYLVMEFVAGLTLQQKIDRDAPLELREILRIGMQIAAGLAAAHHQGVVHRDIKPANVLLENGIQRVKITDFGLARSSEVPALTESGMVAGTPEYMAPEQTHDGNVDFRADLFSLGSVLYAMCTGKSPFRMGSVASTLREVAEKPPRPISELNPEVPEWLIQMIGRLHAKRAEDRFQSAADVERELAAGLSNLQRPVSNMCDRDSAGVRCEHRYRRNWLRAALLATGGALLITVAIVLASIAHRGSRVTGVYDAMSRSNPNNAGKAESRVDGLSPDTSRRTAAVTPNQGGADLSLPITLRRPYDKCYPAAPTDRISVQYAVMAICRNVGIPFQFEKSKAAAGDACRRWVYPDFLDVPAGEALRELLTPLGLAYSVDEQGLFIEPSAMKTDAATRLDLPAARP